MEPFKKILVVADPTASTQPALERAAWLARQNSAALRLAACYYDRFLSGDRFFDSKGLKRARHDTLSDIRDGLENLAKPLREDGLQVSTEAVWDQPLHEGIVREAVAADADVVFKDTHYHPAVERAMLTNTDWNLIRTCPKPLWLVRPREIQEPPRFLAAVDPSHKHEKPAALDDQIIEISQQLAADTDGDMHVFHSYEAITAIGDMAKFALVPTKLPVEELEAELRSAHRQQLDELTQFYGIDADKAHLVGGRAEDTLPALAQELQVAVVVMGAVARNRLRQMFVGNTAERVMDHLVCDLLIVKPAWFKTPVNLRKGREAA